MLRALKLIFIYLVTISLGLILPLSPLTVYAQEDPNNCNVDTLSEGCLLPNDASGDPIVRKEAGLDENGNPIKIQTGDDSGTPVPSAVDSNQPKGTPEDTCLRDDIPFGPSRLGEGAGEKNSGAVGPGEVTSDKEGVTATEEPITKSCPSTDQDNLDAIPLYQGPLAASVDKIETFIQDIGNYETRLVFENPIDKAAFFGENCSLGGADDKGVCPDNHFDQADDIIPNGHWDPPRVDQRMVEMVNYLLKPRKEGGAGREYLAIKRIVSLNKIDTSQTYNKPEPYVDSNGDGKWEKGETLTDLNNNGVWDDTVKAPTDSNKQYLNINGAVTDKFGGISQAMDISAIDRIRITTVVKHRGVVSSNKFTYQPPIPIKVAWQSNEGIQQSPLPDISVPENLQDLVFGGVYGWLADQGLLNDPNLSGRPLESLSTADLSRFVGGRLLQQLLNGEDISKFNFGDTIRDFGVLALAGAFNIDAEAVRHADSLESIEEWEGRAIISKQLNLEKPLEGNTPDELYQSVAKQYLAKLLGTQPYIFDNYNGVDEFKVKLGQGKIERLLKVPDHTFDSDSFSEIKKALGNRFSLIFELNMGGFGQPDASVDEELGITTGTTKRFLTGQLSPTDYKKAVGETVWNSSVGAYNPGTFTPLSPAQIVDQLNRSKTIDNNNANIGTLTAAIDALNNYSNKLLVNKVLTTGINQSQQLNDIQNILGGIITLKNSLDDIARQYPNDRAGFVGQLGTVYTQINVLKGNIAGAQASLNIDPGTKTIAPASKTAKNDPYDLFTSVSDLLQHTRDTLTNYQIYGANPDVSPQNPSGTSQLRDQMYNLPAGTWWTVIGGGSGLKTALSQAGRWLVGQRLPAGSERDGFINNPAAIFQPSNPTLNDTVSVFQAPLPQYEFRRIGREQILTNLSQSAEAQSLKSTKFAREIFFYTDRLEIIRQSLVTIRQNAASLQGSVTADWQQSINKLVDAYSFDPKGVTSMGSIGLIQQNKGDLYQIINYARQSGALSGINNILAACRNIERAIMEISSGSSVAYNSSNSIIPTDLSVPNIDPNKIPGGSTGTINPLNAVLGSDTLVRNAAYQVLAGSDFKQVLFNLGAQSLANLLSLPTNTIYYFQHGAQDMDGFFAAVGEAQENQGVINPSEQQQATYIKRGRDYIANYTIPGLARRLNIGLPDWLPPEAIGNIVMGNPDKALVSIGGAQIENIAGLPHGFISQIVYPPGDTSTEREMNRERAMVSALLSKMDIELNLPPGFMLSNNPVQSMGAARIESILGLKSGELRGTPADISTHLGLGNTTGDANLIQSYERFINLFNIELPPEAATAKQKISEMTNNTEELLRARSIYISTVLEPTVKAALSGQNFTGTNADQRQANFRQRLNYLDYRIGLPDANSTNGEPGKPIGTTQKWLEGAITTDQYISQAGERSAELLGLDAITALLQRIGAPDSIISIFKDDGDTCKSSGQSLNPSDYTGALTGGGGGFMGGIGSLFGGSGNDKCKKSTRSELIGLFKWGANGGKEWGAEQFASVFDILSKAFSFDLDAKLHLTDGTVAELMRHPENAPAIAVDQGVRLMAEQVFHLDLNNIHPKDPKDPGSVFISTLQYAIFHAIYNPVTGRFEPQNFNLQDFTRNVYDPLAQYAQTELLNLIPDPTARQYFSVPLTHLFAVFRGDLVSMDILPRFAQQAVSMQTAFDNKKDLANPSQLEGDFPALADAANTLSKSDNSSDQLLITEKIAKTAKDDNTVNFSSGNSAATTPNDGSATEAKVAPDNPSSSYYNYDSSAKNKDYSEKANENLKSLAQDTKNHFQAKMVVTTDYTAVGKEFAYALGDFGLTKLLNKYHVMPGLTRALMDGTPQERISALAGMAVGYIVQNFPEIRDSMGSFSFLTDPTTVDAIVNIAMNWGKSYDMNDPKQKAAYDQFNGQLMGLVNQAGNAIWDTIGIKSELGKKLLNGFLDWAVGGTDFNSMIGMSDLASGNVKSDSLIGGVFQFGDHIIGLDVGTTLNLFNGSMGLYNAVNDYVNMSPDDNIVATSTVNGKTVTSTSVADQKTDSLVNAAVKFGMILINLAFGKEIAKFEKAIGLPPGTITEGISLAVEGFCGGFANPQFWMNVAKFLIKTILGFGWTTYEIKATADGYYPFVGKLGQFVPPNDPRVKAKNRVPYIQWPSADILSDDGQLATGEALGEFDPTKQAEKVAGFQAAAQSKVRGLLIDLFSTSNRATANGYSEGAKDITGTPWNQQIMPIQVLVHQFNNQNGVTQYVNDPTIMGLRDQYRPLTLDGQTTNWGIGARPEYWDVVHVAW